MTLSKLCELCKPQFLLDNMEIIIIPTSYGYCELSDYKEIRSYRKVHEIVDIMVRIFIPIVIILEV